MTEIRMDMEIPLSVEWMPQNTFMHSSLNRLLPEDQNQSNFVFIKQESEFFESTLNSESVQNIARLQVPSIEKDKEVKQQISCSDTAVTVSFRQYAANSSSYSKYKLQKQLIDHCYGLYDINNLKDTTF